MRFHKRTICVACDLSEYTMKAIEWINCNLIDPSDTIILVHVRPMIQELDLDLTAYYKIKGGEVVTLLTKFKRQFPLNLVEIKILYGDPRKKLLEYVHGINATLLVAGSRGSSVKKRLLGSTSEYLATHSKLPVMIVH